eukprot:4186019-Alexandrium_andersonii.AAC.1
MECSGWSGGGNPLGCARNCRKHRRPFASAHLPLADKGTAAAPLMPGARSSTTSWPMSRRRPPRSCCSRT